MNIFRSIKTCVAGHAWFTAPHVVHKKLLMFCQLLVGEGTRTRSRSYRTSFGPRGCPIDQGCPRQQEIVLFGCCFSDCELLISSSIYIVCGVFILLEISNHFYKSKVKSSIEQLHRFDSSGTPTTKSAARVLMENNNHHTIHGRPWILLLRGLLL